MLPNIEKLLRLHHYKVTSVTLKRVIRFTKLFFQPHFAEMCCGVMLHWPDNELFWPNSAQLLTRRGQIRMVRCLIRGQSREKVELARYCVKEGHCGRVV